MSRLSRRFWTIVIGAIVALGAGVLIARFARRACDEDRAELARSVQRYCHGRELALASAVERPRPVGDLVMGIGELRPGFATVLFEAFLLCVGATDLERDDDRPLSVGFQRAAQTFNENLKWDRARADAALAEMHAMFVRVNQALFRR